MDDARIASSFQASLKQLFELLAGCQFAEASGACEQQRTKKLDLAAPLHRGDCITDLLLRSVRAEEELLNLTAASEHQRKILQDSFTSLSQEAALAATRSGERQLERVSASSRRGSASELSRSNSMSRSELSRVSSQTGAPEPPGSPAAWLAEFSLLMGARREMVRVLREMSQHDALADVREHILALRNCKKLPSNMRRLDSASSIKSHTSSTAPMPTSASASSLQGLRREGSAHRHASSLSMSPFSTTPTFSSLSHTHNEGLNFSSFSHSASEISSVANPTLPGSDTTNSDVLKPFGNRVDDEVRMLLSLLEAYEGIMNYDFLACTQALYTANASLVHIASTTRRVGAGNGRGGPVTGGKTISEWWTQMDGYWGLNTTRALQQFLNSQSVEDGREPDWEKVTVDSQFGPETVSALQMFLNRERNKLRRVFTDDVSYRGNMPKASTKGEAAIKIAGVRGAASKDRLAKMMVTIQHILTLWKEIKVDGEWKQHTKTGLQCYLKYRVGVHTKLEIDGKFHGRSISALQVLPRKIPARKNPEIWSLKLGIFRASSFQGAAKYAHIHLRVHR